jgi:hypothetical protein
MTDALETLAERLDELAEIACSRSIYEGSSGPDRELRAAAAACRELSAQRSEGGYSAIRISDAKEATDAALAAFMEGR